MDTKNTSIRRGVIAKIRRRMEKLELEHLRDHAAELADKVERLQADLEFAESCAMSWRDDCMRMMEDSLPDGGAIGLAKDGSLHVMKPDDGQVVDALLGAAKAAEAVFSKQGWIEGSSDPEAVALTKLRSALAKAGAA